MINLKTLHALQNIKSILPNEFTQEEIESIKSVFDGKGFTKKKYSLYNPNNMLSDSCQWWDDRVYISYGMECEITLVKEKMDIIDMFTKRVDISLYTVKNVNGIPKQYGLWHYSRQWETIEDLKKIKGGIPKWLIN